MEVVTTVSVFFTLILAFALLIERVLEVIKISVSYIELNFNAHRLWTSLACRLAKRLERRLRLFDFVDPAEAQAVLRGKKHLLYGHGSDSPQVIVLSADLYRRACIKIIMAVMGIVLGIIIAHNAGIDFFELCKAVTGEKLAGPVSDAPRWVRVYISGAAMGLGSKPVHKIISAIEDKKKLKEGKI